MAIEKPVVSWYQGTNTTSTEVKARVSFGQVNADDTSPPITHFVWNNRAGLEDAPKMEDVTFTTRDLQGGDGTTVGFEVEAVANNWFQGKVDTLGQNTFTPVGRGGVGTVNPSGLLKLGTLGTTTNVNAATATAWTADATLSLNQYIKPTLGNGFIYKVTKAGVAGGAEPTWLTTEGLIVNDGTAILTAVKIDKKPADQEILGLANNTLPDGSNASAAGGNFIQLTTLVDVPNDATSGKNICKYRINFRYV